MDLDDRLAALDLIGERFAAFLADSALACRPGCAACCTRNVTLTTLEGFALAELLDRHPPVLLAHLAAAASGRTARGLRPQVTINQLAGICAGGGEPPDEAPADPCGLPCSLLEKGRCSVYPRRPIACRIMVSRVVCRPGGSADMPSLLVSAGSVVMQFVEHLDSAGGLCGNLADVLTLFSTAEARRAYRQRLPPVPHDGLIPNHPLRVLMVPPEHRDALLPMVAELRRMVASRR
jgi:Fe-S-cluster containining protein